VTTYKIIRFHANSYDLNYQVTEGLTLAEAQAHCADPETSSTTATAPEAVAYTAAHGPWFDGYREETP
jgi:hypothetical protein